MNIFEEIWGVRITMSPYTGLATAFSHRSPSKICAYSSRVTQPLRSMSPANAGTLGLGVVPLASGERTCGLHLMLSKNKQAKTPRNVEWFATQNRKNNFHMWVYFRFAPSAITPYITVSCARRLDRDIDDNLGRFGLLSSLGNKAASRCSTRCLLLIIFCPGFGLKPCARVRTVKHLDSSLFECIGNSTSPLYRYIDFIVQALHRFVYVYDAVIIQQLSNRLVCRDKSQNASCPQPLAWPRGWGGHWARGKPLACSHPYLTEISVTTYSVG